MLDTFREQITQYGISPTVGVILMVAITVGLAAVVGVTVFGLGDQVSNNTGNIGLDTEQSGSNYTITAQSGQFDSFDYVYVTSTSNVTYSGGVSGETYSGGPSDSIQYLYAENRGGTGTSITVDTSTISESGQIQVIGVANNNKRVLNSYNIETNSDSNSSVSDGSQVSVPAPDIDTSNAPEQANLSTIHANMVGDGTESSPYGITNVYELQAVSQDLTAHYEIIEHINATDTSDWNFGYGFNSVGTQSNPFVGTIDGNEFTIKELSINRRGSSNVGLFGGLGGEIKNIEFRNSTVSGGDRTGVISGEIRQSKATIENITATGEVSGSNDVGGLIGKVNSNVSISKVETNMNVTSDGYVGGIVGELGSGEIKDSSVSGHITGLESSEIMLVGGIVGHNLGTISNVTYNGTVDAASANGIGGLAGRHVGVITNSTSSGSVNSDSGYTAGGLVGFSSATNRGEITHSNSSVDLNSGAQYVGGIAGSIGGNTTKTHASGSVTGRSSSNSIGGFAGEISTNIGESVTNSYSTGNVSVDGNVSDVFALGGFVGTNSGNISTSYTTGMTPETEGSGGFTGQLTSEGKISNSYWNINMTPQSNSYGTTTYQESSSDITESEPLTTSEMTGNAALSNMTGFDFTSVWKTTSDYPELQWETRTT